MPLTTTIVSQLELTAFAQERVNLPKEIADTRRARVGKLRDDLSRWIGENPVCGLVKSYVYGSLAKGTALRVSSDVDLALYLNYTGERRVDRTFLEWIAARLRQAYPQMSPDQIVPQEYSVKLILKGEGFEVDIVPVFYDGDPQDKGWLVSKRTGRLLLTSVPMHLEFIRKRKKACPTHFAQVVRLVKWWSRERKEESEDFHLKSFIVELVLAHLADGGLNLSDYGHAMEQFYLYVCKSGLRKRIVFSDNYDPKTVDIEAAPIEIIDPVNAQNNVTCRYTEQDRQRIVAAASDALDALNEAYTTETVSLAYEMWQVVLGSSFRR